MIRHTDKRMTFLQFTFYGFAAVLVTAALAVVSARNPVKATLFLVLAFFSAACIWMTLQAEFLAIVLVLVYVGAVMVLFLFVVMMLDVDLAALRAGFTDYLPIGGTVALLIMVQLALALAVTFKRDSYPAPPPFGADHSNTEALGQVLYTEYIYAFELAALVLLVAIIAAITLTLRKRPQNRYSAPADQVRVQRKERVRLVNLPRRPGEKPEASE